MGRSGGISVLAFKCRNDFFFYLSLTDINCDAVCTCRYILQGWIFGDWMCYFIAKGALSQKRMRVFATCPNSKSVKLKPFPKFLQGILDVVTKYSPLDNSSSILFCQKRGSLDSKFGGMPAWPSSDLKSCLMARWMLLRPPFFLTLRGWGQKLDSGASKRF